MADDPRSDAGKPSERPYRTIAAELRAAIARGAYVAGQTLPSATMLMAEYGVSRQTVANAMDMLRGEGLVEGRAGAGVYVRRRPVAVRLARNRLSREAREAGRGAFYADAAAAGWTPTVEVTVTVEPATEDVADLLAINPGDEVVVRARVMRADGVPVQIATSRLPRSITAGTRIEDEDTGPSGTYGVLDEMGHRLGHSVERVRTRPATLEEEDVLRLPPAAPVFDVVRVAYTADGRPVEINRIVMAGERFELVYEIDMG
ncbi:GntR family transcriptional regulator [Actinosynnema sp. NPDC023587]|uniref:GntR family transcriptional regulator n=1 Tax=Actinosynnema sp. NPDC023587 TaxID=3154695 RepID=UPI0033D4D15F